MTSATASEPLSLDAFVTKASDYLRRRYERATEAERLQACEDLDEVIADYEKTEDTIVDELAPADPKHLVET
jgi:hypothetical protein